MHVALVPGVAAPTDSQMMIDESQLRPQVDALYTSALTVDLHVSTLSQPIFFPKHI